MTTTVIDFNACIQRIKDEVPSDFFKVIDTAMNLNPLEDDSDLPAVYAYPGYMDANPVTGIRQKINDTLILDVVCKVEDLRDAVRHLRAAFLGWEMTNNHDPFVLAFTGHLQGQACGPIDLQGGVIQWQERYQNATWTDAIYN